MMHNIYSFVGGKIEFQMLITDAQFITKSSLLNQKPDAELRLGQIVQLCTNADCIC